MEARVQEIFSQRTVEKRCYLLHSYVTDVYEGKENVDYFYNFLPQLLLHLFIGKNGSPPWIGETAHDDASALIGILAPTSPLIKYIILKSDDKDVNYYFPVVFLPATTRDLLLRHDFQSLPPLYAGKLDISCSNTTQYIRLNILELYLFYYAAYGAQLKSHSNLSKFQSPPVSGVKLHLRPEHGLNRGASTISSAIERVSGFRKFGTPEHLSDTLNSFFGFFSQTPKKSDADRRIQKSHPYSYVLEDYMRFFVYKSFGDIGPFEQLSFLDREYYTWVQSESNRISYTIFQIVLEFWLNQYDHSTSKTYFPPSPIIIECITIVLKALFRHLKTMRASKYPAQVECVPALDHRNYANQEEIYLYLIHYSARKPLYWFFSRAFEYTLWSSHTMNTLAYIVELWVMCTRPWALSFPSWMPTGSNLFPELETTSKSHNFQHSILDFVKNFWKADAKSSTSSSSGLSRSGNVDPGSCGSESFENQFTNAKQLLQQEQARKAFVAKNFLWYVPVLIWFLNMALRFDFSQELELDIFSYVLSSWSQKDLLNIIWEFEQYLQTANKRTNQRPEKNVSPSSLASPSSVESVITVILNSLPPGLHIRHCLLREHSVLDCVRTIISRLRRQASCPGNSDVASEMLKSCIQMLQYIFRTEDTKFVLEKSFSPFVAQNKTCSPSSPTAEDADYSKTPKGPTFQSRAPSLAAADATFLGDERLRPITSGENATLVRFFYHLSKFIDSKTDVYVDLRILASYKIYAWTALTYFALLILISIFKLYRAG
ncbi:uncharacterized protein LOC126323914 [Schistocerca gregaria]|uniref:uncharacterized protein LOC126323914 n=1 Tax=Schistocerca gregaria TaxID=7010 RepID=UPI00211E44A0|nr:uncharacterized protein LOC126323914 [Schistocerca gregaria]